ncbi:MAG: hypothetical protein IJ022_03435, partial [Burkholderiaceae bacterium]|nr:hypothetical protein [Burkholderiaceae bacterium]
NPLKFKDYLAILRTEVGRTDPSEAKKTHFILSVRKWALTRTKTLHRLKGFSILSVRKNGGLECTIEYLVQGYRKY